MYSLDDALNTYIIPFAHDGLEFQLKPFSTARVSAWNRAVAIEEKDGESPIDFSERARKAQFDVLTAHIRECVSEGNSKKVTAKWLEQLPEVVLVDLASFFGSGTRPKWAADTPNPKS